MYNHLSACGRAKNIQLPNTLVKFRSKLRFGTDMFTFDTCLRFTLTFKDINVQR